MPRINKILSLAAWAVVAAGAPAQAHRSTGSAFEAAFGSCGDRCVIRYNPGGVVPTFLAAALAVRAGEKKLVVIDGPCISACAIFADVARAKVCITDRAKFGFHKGREFASERRPGGKRVFRELGRRDPPHSRDIASWVQRNGGFPYEGLRVMNSKQAGQFWRRCPGRA